MSAPIMAVGAFFPFFDTDPMKYIASLIALGMVASADAGEPTRQKDRTQNFTIDKETTHVNGPLDKEGRIDYAAALNKRLGKGVKPETNSNVLFWQAFGPRPEGGRAMPAEFFKLMGMKEPPEKGDYLVDAYHFAKEQLGIDDQEHLQEIEEQSAKAGKRPWSAKTNSYLADWLNGIEKPLKTFIEGTKRPQYFSPMIPQRDGKGASNGLFSALLPATQKCRSVARALMCRAMLRLNDGKLDEAWSDILACHRLARHLAHGPLIESLVAIGIESLVLNSEVAFLQNSKLDSKRILACLKDLQSLPPMPSIAECVDGTERFSFLDELMLIDRSGLRSLVKLDAPIPPGAELPRGPVTGIDWDPALRHANQLFDRMSRAMRQPTRQKRQEELNLIDDEFRKSKKRLAESGKLNNALVGVEGMTPAMRGKIIGDLLIAMVMPFVSKVQIASDRREQSERNLHVAFALSAYQRDHKRFPKSLDDLAPKYLSKVPGDLFSGKAIIYKPNEKGFLIYSVGPDGRDDEGRYYDDEPRGDDPNVRIPAR